MVTLRALLVPLARVSALVFVLGIIFCVDVFCRAIFGTLEGSIGWMPVLNRLVAAPIHRIDQKVSNYLGGLESHIDISMGGYIHALAIGVGQLASGEAEAGWAMWLLAKVLHATRVTVNALPSGGSVVKVTRVVVKQTRVIVKQVDHVGKIAAHAAPGSLVRVVRAIAGTLDDVVTWDIPRLWKRTRALEREIGRLARGIRRRAVPIATGAAVGALVYALSKIGASWIRCSNVRKLGRRVCGMNVGLLESLLTGLTAVVGAISLVAFAHVLIDAMDEFVSAVQGFIRETHDVPSRTAAQQGFAATGGSVNFRTPQEQGFA
jgi:hypothetical protein